MTKLQWYLFAVSIPHSPTFSSLAISSPPYTPYSPPFKLQSFNTISHTLTGLLRDPSLLRCPCKVHLSLKILAYVKAFINPSELVAPDNPAKWRWCHTGRSGLHCEIWQQTISWLDLISGRVSYTSWVYALYRHQVAYARNPCFSSDRITDICFYPYDHTYINSGVKVHGVVRWVTGLSLIHIWRCRRIERCRSRWSPYH